jgi:hypothetical protein
VKMDVRRIACVCDLQMSHFCSLDRSVSLLEFDIYPNLGCGPVRLE